MTNAPQVQDVSVTTSVLPVDHVKINTPKPYAEVKAALESRLGRLDDAIRDLLKKNEIEAVRAALQKAAGEDGLAIHYVGPHGDWLALKGDGSVCVSDDDSPGTPKARRSALSCAPAPRWAATRTRRAA